jgi:hypothetical protein
MWGGAKIELHAWLPYKQEKGYYLKAPASLIREKTQKLIEMGTWWAPNHVCFAVE